MNCTTNPSALVGVVTADGTIFNSSNSLFVNQAYNTTDGTWIVAASRTRPETGFSGDGLAFTMNYRLDSLTSSPVNCTVIALDMDGNDLPFDMVNTTFTPADAPVEATGGSEEPPTLDEEPLPTNVPTLEPTIAPTEEQPTEVPSTVTPVENTVTLSGTAAYQLHADNLGIEVQLFSNGQVIDETLTDSEGNYTFNNVALGDYLVEASATGHLPVARQITLDASGQSFVLDRLTLIAGDIDDSGSIDLADASLIGANFGLEGSLFPPGDLNTDNIINISDLVIIGANFGLNGVITLP